MSTTGPCSDARVERRGGAFRNNRFQPPRPMECSSPNLVSSSGRRCRILDLPCIIKASKTLDMEIVIKTADVSQMLLVERRIQNEEVIKDIELTAAD
jgi:hypothetical protein